MDRTSLSQKCPWSLTSRLRNSLFLEFPCSKITRAKQRITFWTTHTSRLLLSRNRLKDRDPGAWKACATKSCGVWHTDKWAPYLSPRADRPHREYLLSRNQAHLFFGTRHTIHEQRTATSGQSSQAPSQRIHRSVSRGFGAARPLEQMASMFSTTPSLRLAGHRAVPSVVAPCVRVIDQPSSRVSTPRPSSASAAASQAWASSASAAASQALASYALPLQLQPASGFPTKRWSTQMWFEAMVQLVVKQLDGGAFLLRVNLQPVVKLQLVRLDAADLAAGWEHIQQRHLSSAVQQDDAVILVHPVASEQQPCVVRQVAGEACPGCPHTQPPAGLPTELLHGKLGDCCHENNEHHHQHSSSSSTPAAAAVSGGQQQQQQQPETQTAFYGLVVQCRNVADSMQGCYLLKTMKQSSSSSSSCHCTHYTLNRVCKGPSLQQQYQASWLV